MAKAAHLRNCSNSIQRFIRNKKQFVEFNSFEDWYIASAEINESNANKELEHLSAIKKYFDIEFRARDYYLSSNALDEIIFLCIQNSTVDSFILDVFSQIELQKLNATSIVIFPVHNFGFQFIGFNNLFNRALAALSFNNFLISTQTNSFSKTVDMVDKFCQKKINRKLDKTMFLHLYKSRSLKWLESNPLLIFCFNFSQVTPFENLTIILEKLSHVTNQLYFLSVLRSDNSKIGKLFSTKQTNNWETLDLNHFLTINGFNNSILCKPIHYKYDLLFNEMHLNIDLLSKTKKVYKWESDSIRCLEKIYEGNKNFLLTQEIKYSIYHKINNSLKYFRRSVKSVNIEDKIIHINIAIEALLLDNEGDKVVKIFERLSKSLKYYRNKKAVLEEIDKVIKERNNVIHNASLVLKKIDFAQIYRMYCKVVSFITENAEEIDCTKSNKMSLFYNTK